MKNIAFENYLGAIIKKKWGSASAASTLNDGIVAFWKLDEASGTRVDEVGSNDLTDNNTVAQTDGVVGKAAQFVAAQSEYLSIADNPALSITGSMTIAGHFRIDDASDAAVHYLLSKYNVTGDQRSFRLEYSNSSNFLIWHVSSAGTGATLTSLSATTFGNPTEGQWYFFKAWHDAVTEEIGISFDLSDTQTAAHSNGIHDGSAPFLMNAKGTGDSHGSISLDAIGIWNRVTTSEEDAELYNSGAGKEHPF